VSWVAANVCCALFRVELINLHEQAACLQFTNPLLSIHWHISSAPLSIKFNKLQIVRPGTCASLVIGLRMNWKNYSISVSPGRHQG
jgi:hypothetical protein